MSFSISSFAGTVSGTENGTEIIRVENVGIQALGYAELASTASNNDERLVRVVALASNGRYLVAVRSNIGIMRMKGAYLDSALTVEDGNFAFYYANGRIESEGHYLRGNKSGTWLRYGMDGARMAERNYTGMNTEQLLTAVGVAGKANLGSGKEHEAVAVRPTRRSSAPVEF